MGLLYYVIKINFDTTTGKENKTISSFSAILMPPLLSITLMQEIAEATQKWDGTTSKSLTGLDIVKSMSHGKDRRLSPHRQYKIVVEARPSLNHS